MTAQSFRLDGRVALVTGSSKGLGKAIALRLGAAGARVALNYKNDEASARAAWDEYRAAGHAGGLYRASAIDEGEVDAMVAQVEHELGPIDIVVVNATPAQPLKPIEEYDWDFHQAMLDYFVKSPFLLTRSAYVAAKGAQNGWTRSMARELAPFGITVNMVSPGWIPVERHKDDPAEMKDEYLRGIPVGRWGVPDDVAGAVLYLASDEASFVAGVDLHVNGGVTVG
jgi:3-oxoacyl-[acyl-carrier protein] reductase